MHITRLEFQNKQCISAGTSELWVQVMAHATQTFLMECKSMFLHHQQKHIFTKDTIAHLLCCTTTTTTFQFFLNSIVLYIIFIPLGYQCFKNLFFIYTCKFANIFHHFWLNGYITCQKSSQRSCISEIKVNVLQNHITNVSSITGTCHVLGFKQYRHSFTKHRLLVLSSQSPQVNL